MNGNEIIIIQGSFPGNKPHASVLLHNQPAALLQNSRLIQQKPGMVNSAQQIIKANSNQSAYQLDTKRLNLNMPGKPLPQEVLQKMEKVFNTNLSGVRIHTEDRQAESIGALAFTTGNNIYFASGLYNPNTPHGQRILGHELAHVVQQKAGRVKNPFGGGTVVVQDPGLEAEAERYSIKLTQFPVNDFAVKPGDAGNNYKANNSGTVQLKKQLREAKKRMRKAINKATNQKYTDVPLPTTKRCVAFNIRNKKKELETLSGAAGFLPEYNDVLPPYPWTGMVNRTRLPFANCAEAHMWFQMKIEEKNPADYLIKTLENATTSPPCLNCSQWVYATFGGVVKK